MQMSHKLVGFNEFAKQLEQLPQKTLDRALQRAVNAGMRVGRKSLRDAAPRHADRMSPISKKYGPLRSNIRLIKLDRVPKNSKAARVDTHNAPQGFWYHFGTRFQPPRPWWDGTVMQASTAIFDAMRKVLVEFLEAQWGK